MLFLLYWMPTRLNTRDWGRILPVKTAYRVFSRYWTDNRVAALKSLNLHTVRKMMDSWRVLWGYYGRQCIDGLNSSVLWDLAGCTEFFWPHSWIDGTVSSDIASELTELVQIFLLQGRIFFKGWQWGVGRKSLILQVWTLNFWGFKGILSRDWWHLPGFFEPATPLIPGCSSPRLERPGSQAKEANWMITG